MRIRRVVAAIALVVGALLLLGLLGGGLLIWPGMMHYGVGYSFRFLPWIGLGALLFKTLIIVGGLLIVVELLHHRGMVVAEAGAAGYRPMEIARERYARGEISKEQFDQMRQDLERR